MYILRGDVKYKIHLTLKVEKFKNRLLGAEDLEELKEKST